MPSTPRADTVTQPRHSPNFFQEAGSPIASPAHALSRSNSLEGWEQIESPTKPQEEGLPDTFEPIERAVKPLTEEPTDGWVDVNSNPSTPPNALTNNNDWPSIEAVGEKAANLFQKFKRNITSLLPTADATQAALLAATMTELAAANQRITELQSTLNTTESSAVGSEQYLQL